MIGHLVKNAAGGWSFVDKMGNREDIPLEETIELFNGFDWSTTKLVLRYGHVVAADGSALYPGKWARWVTQAPSKPVDER